MSTELIKIDACSHPELTEYVSHLPDTGMTYQCPVCKKKIVIPSSTIMAPVSAEDVNESIAGILGLTFGEHWREKMKQSQQLNKGIVPLEIIETLMKYMFEHGEIL